MKSWKLFAIKEPVVVRTYKLRSSEGGAQYSWSYRLIDIPGNFKLIVDSPHISYISYSQFKTSKPS